MENLNLIDLTNLIEAVIAVLIAVAMRYLIPYLATKLSKEQQENLATFFDIAVLAAEKLYGAKRGDEKLAYVEHQLEARGIKIDTMRLKMFVNASIKKMEQATLLELVTGEIETSVAIEEGEEEDEEPQTEDAREGA